MKITRAITHIKIEAANTGKLTALDQLAEAYIALCQEYVTHFCTLATPNKFATPIFASPLSARWQRCAIQQATGIAKAWRSNHDHAYAAYQARLASYHAKLTDGSIAPDTPAPTWHKWQIPQLGAVSLQANANVAQLEASDTASFDYWLKVATLDKGKPIRLPIMLSKYHQQQLVGHTLNTSLTISRRDDGSWWLTLTYDADVATTTPADASVVGVDVGVTNFLTTSSGQRYGAFDQRLRQRLERERSKRQRKAKLRACLKQRGVTKLPSTQNVRLSRHVRQEINRCVNQFYADHAQQRVAIEKLSVSTMRYKAKSLAVLIRASQLAHLPRQLKWGAAKRGITIIEVNPAYSSQQCPKCWYTAKANRPTQETFSCRACGHQAHADANAAENLAARADDGELAHCKNKDEVRLLLDAGYRASAFGLPVVQPPVQLSLWGGRT